MLIVVTSIVACAPLLQVPMPPAAPAPPQNPSVVRPDAPGQPSQRVSVRELETMVLPLHTAADVAFIHLMIEHHAQAMELTILVPDRTDREDVLLLARRIQASQADEIRWMEGWLKTRGEPAADTTGDHHASDHHAPTGDPAGSHPEADRHPHRYPVGVSVGMPGMLTRKELDRLAAARGSHFDRLFLEFMIFHHEGAILMVEELFASAGGGQDGETYEFASHVKSDQRIEINRMRHMLAKGNGRD